ncbi:alpha-(1,4)-fucosyltransferase [Ananas comosus]|uniref:Fucosyltransferase n=2 Tax=Ananas comosus TaxID=4615 RepID=A0A199VQA7_ANACO|nr:alpha-(1,4)-fucosyltransferase [Ananas comosus]OAY79377.1 Alpha-(1,4)-fucosyltransferase [Ananas comosus]
MLPLKRINYLAPMLASALLLLLLLSGSLEFPSLSSPFPTPSTPVATFDPVDPRPSDPFTDLLSAFARWDAEIGCARFRDRYGGWTASASAIQDSDGGGDCTVTAGGLRHVSVVVKGWTWIPDNLDGFYSCRCGITCLWTKSEAVVDKPDALLYENAMPPRKRRKGDPLRVYIDLEASRKPTGFEDIFIGYHAKDDVQATYAGKSFHISRSYHVSTHKRNDILVYWSSSRCLEQRDQLAKSFLSLVPHHSFGKCLNNVGGLDKALSFYPDCSVSDSSAPHWWDHLHCSMSNYKFVLAIENTRTESYVTEKLFYALEAGAVPIYFGAPNVWDFVPPNSIIDGSKFKSIEELASYVKALADDPIAYAEYHAWRRCGVVGNYGRTRAASLDTVPCRLCELVSRKGGRNARSL